MLAIETLQMFVTAARKGSLMAAGRSLGLSQATMSRRIASLEQDLGVLLLDRASRQLRLTEAGEAFLPRAEAILDAMAQAREQAQDARSRPEGRLRVHARTLIGMRLIAPLLPRFAQLHPGIQIDFMLSDEPINIAEHHFDLDIRTGVFNDSSFALRRLCSVRDVLVASPAYLQRRDVPQQPQDLLAHDCMTYRKSLEPTAWLWRDAHGVHELAIQGPLHSNSGEVLRQSALRGLGIALLAEPTVREDLDSGALVTLLDAWRMTNSTFDNGVFAVFRAGVLLPQKVRVFIDYLTAALQDSETADLANRTDRP